MAHKYNVYISEYSYKPEHKPQRTRVGLEAMGYHRRVLADGRIEALEKCLPDIKRELPKIQGKYVSVYVGLASGGLGVSASRLTPIQVVVETGEVRRQS